MFKYKPQLLFHHTARFPWHPLFLNLSLPSLQCQECPRSNLSGMCPVCTSDWAPYPSPVIPISKGLTRFIPRDPKLVVDLPSRAQSKRSAFLRCSDLGDPWPLPRHSPHPIPVIPIWRRFLGAPLR